MPRLQPHPLALFSLLPLNDRAKTVLAHPSNEHLVSLLKTGEPVLDIGHIRPTSGDSTTLATLGRNGDVVMEGSIISKIQCSFEIDLDTKVVMFYDRSHNQTSQVYGQDASPFEYGRPRKIVVQDHVNTIIGMGGVGRNLIQFQLIWYGRPTETMGRAMNREGVPLEENPRLARTIDEMDTDPPSRMETRVHTPGPRQREVRFRPIGLKLGSGQFGQVHKVVDLDTGKLMAVKKIKRHTSTVHQQELVRLKREVEILSRISHDHIVDYISSQGWDGPEVDILMGLKEGTLESLLYSQCSIPINDLGQTVLHHMLQAIDCLAMQGIIHRDVKPENILYISRQGQYHFQLGDFGLSNRQIIAITCSGTPLYMAPEMFQNGEQTHKADVWSLFVTMLCTLNTQGFREVSKSFETYQDARRAILSAASSVDVIQEMARIDPQERASAAQILVKCYNGQGLTTPRNQVPPIRPPRNNSDAPTANAKNKAPAQPQPGDFRGNANPAAGQFRVEMQRADAHDEGPLQLRDGLPPVHAALPRGPHACQAQPRQPGVPSTEKLAGQALSRTPAISFLDDAMDISAERKSGPDLRQATEDPRWRC